MQESLMFLFGFILGMTVMGVITAGLIDGRIERTVECMDKTQDSEFCLSQRGIED